VNLKTVVVDVHLIEPPELVATVGRGIDGTDSRAAEETQS
jgi:hypothetical protein